MAEVTIPNQTDGVRVAVDDLFPISRSGAARKGKILELPSFTPVLAFGGASVGITYAAQIGIAYRFGPLIFTSILIELTSKGSSTGSATITGLPVTVTTNGQADSIVRTNFAQIVIARFVGGGTTIVLELATGAAGPVTDAHLANTSTLRFGGFYFA